MKLYCSRCIVIVMCELGRKEKGMDPRNWAWNLQDNRLVPVMSTTNAAPDNLLKSIHGNCSTACKTLRCSCRGMDYHVQLSVDRARLKNVTIHRTGFSQRSREMMMNKD